MADAVPTTSWIVHLSAQTLHAQEGITFSLARRGGTLGAMAGATADMANRLVEEISLTSEYLARYAGSAESKNIARANHASSLVCKIAALPWLDLAAATLLNDRLAGGDWTAPWLRTTQSFLVSVLQ